MAFDAWPCYKIFLIIKIALLCYFLKLNKLKSQKKFFFKAERKNQKLKNKKMSLK